METSSFQLKSSYEDVIIAIEELQTLGLCSALKTFFEQGEFLWYQILSDMGLGFSGLIRRTASIK
jgi:hypothetical protein